MLQTTYNEALVDSSEIVTKKELIFLILPMNKLKNHFLTDDFKNSPSSDNSISFGVCS
jgi:hypothetical protein